MRNMLATWDLPTTRVDGGELLVDDISHVEASLNAGAGFSTPVEIPATQAPEWAVNDLDFGSYVLRLVVVLLDGQRSQGVDTPFEALDNSAPGEVLNVTVLVS